jgi:hypothetical protein
MTETAATVSSTKTPKQTFYALVRAALAKKHPIYIDGKRRWLTLEEIIQRHLVFAQAKGSKRALRLSVMIKRRFRLR